MILTNLLDLVLGKKRGDETGEKLEANKASDQFLCKCGSG